MAAGKKRIYLLDELRGLAVFCMVFYHAFYSMSEFFNIAVGTKLLDFFTPAEPFFAALFIVISGISSRLSHNNTKRGVRLLCVALALTVVTAVIMPMMHFEGAEIYFGILHLLSLSMLIFSALRAGLDKINPIVGSEKQSEELIAYLLTDFEENPKKIWESNIFGKSLHELVNEGLHNKLYRMPADARMKLQETIQRIINEGCGGLICIIL